MKTKILKWGNSLAVRIPKNYADDLNINQGSNINLIEEKDKLIIKPEKKSEKLNILLKKINSDNLHKEIKTGKKVGNEIW